LQSETFKEISDLQSDVTRLDIANREYTKDIRQLEQQNDDLDRTNRYWCQYLQYLYTSS